MKISYEREMNQNLLVVSHLGEEDLGNELRMMEQTSPKHFLKLHLRRMNGEWNLLYEINGYQSLSRLFERRPLGKQDLRQVFHGLYIAAQECDRFLADPGDMLLAPTEIFLSLREKEAYFCLVPGAGALGLGSVRSLAEFFLKHLDHADFDAVDLGYRFFEMAREDPFPFLEFYPLLFGGGQSREKADDGNAPQGDIGDLWMQKEMDVPAFETPSPGAEKKQFRGRELKALATAEKKNPGKSPNPFRLYLAAGILSGALYVLLLCLLEMSVLQMGGLFFLMAAVTWLVIGVVTGGVWDRSRVSSGRFGPPKTDTFAEAEEEAFLQALMEDVYDPSALMGASVGEIKTGAFGIGAGQSSVMAAAPEDPYDHETRYLLEMPQLRIRLVSMNPRKSTDLVLESHHALIGKSVQDTDLQINVNVISRMHAKLELEQEKEIYLTDLNSMNGTFVNGVRLAPNERRRVYDGDRISFASVHFQLRVDS